MTDLWTEASRDVEAENAERVLAMAKVASAEFWPFLAMASTPSEFLDRVALSSEKIRAVASATGCPEQTLLGSFEADFGLLMEARTASVPVGSQVDRDGHDYAHDDKFPDGVYGTDELFEGGSTDGPYDAAGYGVSPYARSMMSSRQHIAAPAPGDDAIEGGETTGHGVDPYAGKGDFADTVSRTWNDNQRSHPGENGPGENDFADVVSQTWNNNLRGASAQHFATLKQALEEGQDPLEWLEEGGQGTPELAGGHSDGPNGTTASRRPFA